MNNKLIIYSYLIPFIICLIHYSFLTLKNIKKEFKERDTAYDLCKLNIKSGEYYFVPRENLGEILKRLFVTVTPVVNIFACIFDICPVIWDKWFNKLFEFIHKPIVPTSDSYKKWINYD